MELAKPHHNIFKLLGVHESTNIKDRQDYEDSRTASAGRHHLFCFILKLCMLRFILITVHLVSFLHGVKFVIHCTFFGFFNGILQTRIVTIIY